MEFLGIDIGGTKCAVVRGNEKGQVIEKIKFPTTDVNETLANIFSAAEKIKGNSAAVGISCGGPLEFRNGNYSVSAQSPRLGQDRNSKSG